MSVKVRIPAPLRRVTNGLDTVELTASTLVECLAALETQFPGMRERLQDEQGELHSFINIYVNGEDVRFLQELATRLTAGDEVLIMPAIAGG